jgi:PST family polysaccharide transporter
MAATVSGFIGVIGDAGISSTVVRMPNLDAAAEVTAFWLSIAGGCVLALVSAIAAPIIGWFYKSDAIRPLSFLLATTFLLAAPGRVSSAKLARQLRFRASTTINIAANAAAAALAVVLAARGFGAWALGIQMAATFAMQAALAMVVSPPRVKPSLYSRLRAREIAAFGSQLSGFSMATTVGRSLDNILAGRLIGTSAVGFMAMGVKLVFFPVERLCGAIYQVFLPTTVEMADPAQQARAFQSAHRLLLLVVAPFAFGTMAIAPEIVALLPPKWAGLSPLLVVYAATTLILPVNYLALAVLITHGKANVLLRMSIALVPVCWLGAAIGAFAGSVLAMVCAWSFAIVVAAGIAFGFVWRPLGLTREFWGKTLVPLSLGIGMAVAVRVIVHVSGLGGRRVGFVVGAASGALIYAVLVAAVMRQDVARVLDLLRRAVSGRRGASL